VTREDWRALLVALESGVTDAYSHWCNQTNATEIRAEDAEAMGLD
jgi:hypothetical protein